MKRILVIEQNELSRDRLARLLVSRGFEALMVGSGQEGLSVAETTRPDLMLVELAMPVMDGWEVARRLKASPTTRRIPLIAIATEAKSRERERALKSGFTEFQTKPIDFQALTAKIDRLQVEA